MIKYLLIYFLLQGECSDHLGADKLSEVVAHLGGRMIPMVPLLSHCCHREPDSGVKPEIFMFKSSIEYLLSSERLYKLAFPSVEGILLWEQGRC